MAEPAKLPRGGGKPRRGPDPPVRNPRKAEKVPPTPRSQQSVYVAREKERARRRTITHRAKTQRTTFTQREGELRTTSRERARVQLAKENAAAQNREARAGQGQAATSIFAGLFRVLAIVIVLAMLYLVLSNPGPSSGLVGGIGQALYHFTTSSDPLFKKKGS